MKASLALGLGMRSLLSRFVVVPATREVSTRGSGCTFVSNLRRGRRLTVVTGGRLSPAIDPVVVPVLDII